MSFSRTITYDDPLDFSMGTYIYVTATAYLLVDPSTGAYPTSNQAILENSGGYADALYSISHVAEITAGSYIYYQINVDGVNKWYNGTGWTTATYESNAITTTNSNITTLDISDGALVKVRALMVSADGSQTPKLTSVTLEYSFYAGPATEVTMVTVYGYVKDINDDPVEGAKVEAIIDTPKKYSDDIILFDGSKSATTNALGYWELELIDMENAGGAKYLFKFYDTDGNVQIEERKTLADTTTAAYNSL